MSNGQAASNAGIYSYFTAPSFSYNATTGVLTCGNGTSRGRFVPGQGFVSSEYNVYTYPITTAYCIYIE